LSAFQTGACAGKILRNARFIENQSVAQSFGLGMNLDRCHAAICGMPSKMEETSAKFHHDEILAGYSLFHFATPLCKFFC
jgi:hypothetical protein